MKQGFISDLTKCYVCKLKPATNGLWFSSCTKSKCGPMFLHAGCDIFTETIPLLHVATIPFSHDPPQKVSLNEDRQLKDFFLLFLPNNFRGQIYCTLCG